MTRAALDAWQRPWAALRGVWRPLMASQARPDSPRPPEGRSRFTRSVMESDLPPSTRHVLVTIAWSAGRDGTGSYLSVAAVAARTGLKERRVQQLIASAITLGWLRREPRAGRTNDWVLTVPQPVLEGCTPVQGGVQPSAPGGAVECTRRKVPTKGLVARDARTRRPWCGSCDEATRQVEQDDGRVARCPRCHPNSKSGARSARTSIRPSAQGGDQPLPLGALLPRRGSS
jgi:hypothetical protein